ncbi:uncharacterized protein LOC144535980 isoform X2 [Sander vitreus]
MRGYKSPLAIMLRVYAWTWQCCCSDSPTQTLEKRCRETESGEEEGSNNSEFTSSKIDVCVKSHPLTREKQRKHLLMSACDPRSFLSDKTTVSLNNVP